MNICFACREEEAKIVMKSMKKDWYKKVWTMDIQNMSWVEDTKNEVDFLIDQLKLQGNERILDLACKMVL